MKKVLSNLSFIAACLCIAASSSSAKPVPSNLGNGLDRLVESNLAIKSSAKANKKLQTFASDDGRRFTTEANARLASLAFSDEQSRILVRINMDGSVKPEDAATSLPASAASLTVTAVDKTYRGVGVMNAWVSMDDVPALANAPGVRSVILELRPRHNRVVSIKPAPVNPNATIGENIKNLGTFCDQGVFQHRVDQIDKYYNPGATSDYEGANLSIACISNSFAANAAHPASTDVTNNDLPGNASNPVGNTNPVFVLIDDTSSSTSDDEGRGMCQIVYHMAPKARVGFGTADTGEAGFANVIRGLAGINSSDFPNASTQGFAADVICDDVGYFDEPFFEDGIIGAGINDVAAAGVSYFSSAANDIGVNGYDSVTRWVANGSGLTAGGGNTALTGTNIDLTNVPTSLYAGGFHNFNPNPGQQDVAQTVNITSTANEPPTVLQWNDPYDQNTAPTYTATLFSTTDTYTTADKTYTVTATITQGTLYEVKEAATAGSTFDGIVTVYRSDGTTVIAGPQDTGTDETVRFFAPVNDTGFVVKIGHFSTTTGGFTVLVRSASGFPPPVIQANLTLLVFNLTTGAYLPNSSLTTDTRATNQPIQLGVTARPSGATQVQYVIARANVPSDPTFPTRVRYSIPGNGLSGIGPAEYFTYNTVTTSGHAIAAGCNGTAAYGVFRPSVPESFTSPGPATIYYDSSQNFLNPPQIRLQPGVAAADAANISANEGSAGLGSDSASDFDSAANFSGTSAAAPHAAACALLVLEGHGGHRSVTPAQMTTLLHNSAFPHDLDPNFSSGAAYTSGGTQPGGRVTVTFNSDNDSNGGTGVNDANSLAIAYNGPAGTFIQSVVFNSQHDAAHGGNTSGGNNGLDASNNYFSNIYPGLVFPVSGTGFKAFTVGSSSTVSAANVTSTLTNVAPAPSTTQAWTHTLTFASNGFGPGQILRYTIGRALQHGPSLSGAVAGNGPTGGTTVAQYSADLFGGTVVIPDAYVSGTGYTYSNTGMSFTGTVSDGSTFSGTLNNNIGNGYSVLDGFGFINAEVAVAAPVQ